MARGVNKVILIGNLGADPEVKRMTSGDSVTNISIATSESWVDKNTNQRQERTEWHRVVAFRQLADIMAQYLRKGSQVYIEGKLQTRKWQDQNGMDRYTTEIIANNMEMLGGRNSGTGGDIGMYGNNIPQQNQGMTNPAYQSPTTPNPNQGYTAPQTPTTNQGYVAPSTPPNQNQGNITPQQPTPNQSQGNMTPQQSTPNQGQGNITPQQSTPNQGQGNITPQQPASNQGQGNITPQQPNPNQGQNPAQPASTPAKNFDDFDDDIPF